MNREWERSGRRMLSRARVGKVGKNWNLNHRQLHRVRQHLFVTRLLHPKAKEAVCVSITTPTPLLADGRNSCSKTSCHDRNGDSSRCMGILNRERLTRDHRANCRRAWSRPLQLLPRKYHISTSPRRHEKTSLRRPVPPSSPAARVSPKSSKDPSPISSTWYTSTFESLRRAQDATHRVRGTSIWLAGCRYTVFPTIKSSVI
jgi:hypothetical protein